MTPESLSSQTGDAGNGSRPPSLASVLGVEMIRDTIASFVDYLETAVMAFERDGAPIGDIQAENGYFRLLADAINHDPDVANKFHDISNPVLFETIREGRQMETVAFGMTMCICPVLVQGKSVGAVAGVVSEAPLEGDALESAAAGTGIDIVALRTATRSLQKPESLYQSARKFLARLAATLARLYEDTIEGEETVARISANDLELAATRELDERILGSITTGIAVFDLDQKVRVWNAAAEAISGLASDQALGHRLAGFFPTGDSRGMEQNFLNIVETGKSWHGKGLDFSADAGKPLVLDVTAAPLRDKSKAISGVVVLFDDVTEDVELRGQLDQRIGELEALNRVIAAASGSLDRNVLLNHASVELKNNTEAELIAIYTLNDGKLTLAGSSMSPDEQVLDAVGEYPVGKGPVGRVAETGKVEVVFDMAVDDRIRKQSKELSSSRGFNSLLAMPIKARGQVLGVLTALAASPKICTEQQIRFIEMLSDQLGIAMENSRLFGEVERSGQFMENVLESMAEGAYTCDLQRNFTYLNASAEKITGYQMHELIGKSISILIPEDEVKKLDEMRLRRNQGLVDRYDLDIIRKDGRRITINQTVAPLFQQGEIVGLVGVAADVTKRREISRRLEQQNQRLGLLQSITAKSVSGLGSGKALKTLVQEVAETFGYEICNIFMPDASGDKLQIVASHGYDDDFLRSLNAGESFSLKAEQPMNTPVLVAFREGRQKVIIDVPREGCEGRLLEAARIYGFNSMAATPMEYHGERIGALVVCTEASHQFDEVELGLLASIAAQASIIAGSAIVYDQLTESEQRFRELYNTAADWMYSLDMDGKIIECNDTMSKALGVPREQLIGSRIYDYEAEPDREKALAAINNFKQKPKAGMTFKANRTFLGSEGRSLVIELHAVARLDETGDSLQWGTIGRDVTAEQRMNREILRRNRELAVLNAIATTTAASLDLDSTLKSAVKSVLDSMNYDAGIIFLNSPDGKQLTPRATLGIPDDMLESAGRIRVGDGYAGVVAATSTPLFAHDQSGDQNRMPGFPEKAWFASYGVVPVIAKDEMLGVMLVGTSKKHEFDESERQLLLSVSRSIGVAIDNARLFDGVMRGKNEWESTFDAMTNGVSIHSRDYTIVRANRSLARLLGTTTDNLIGKKCYEVFHNLNDPIAGCPQKKAFEEGISHSIIVEEPYLGRTLNVSSDPIFDKDGNITGSVHDVRDITEQEHLREQLTQSEKIRALGEMAGGVAHDFNNFLTVILGNTQLLLAQLDASGDDHEEDFRKELESVQRAARDAADTVRRIQEFTRVRTTRSFTPVQLNHVIKNAIDVARPRWRDEADARSVTIELKTELADIPPVNANEAELGEVMVNLVLNAADALPSGGLITLSTDIEPGNQWVRASVADNGEGMEEDIRKRIFEPFFTTKGVAGSGLGLSVAYGIIHRHGGDIMVESKPGEGARFTVRLPVATVDEISSAVEKDEADHAAGQKAEHAAKVLVIDDAPMIRTLLGDMLEKLGHTCETAGGGAEGLAAFEAARLAGKPFDLVLSDLGMPEVSGWEVADAVKRSSPKTPVALITGWGDQLDAQRMKQSPVDAVIAKPFRVEDIRKLLAEALA